jgi:branched-chain amino acid aminotransferase
LRADNLKTHVMIASWAWPSYMDPEARDRGIRIATSSYTRHHVNITMCKAKANGNYINSILALREAMDAGFEEALLLDNEGYVAEGSGENFFLVRDGVLYTPELTSCLEGITRDSILRIAADLGLTVREKRITRDEVYVADEAFFTGTAAEVVPIPSWITGLSAAASGDRSLKSCKAFISKPCAVASRRMPIGWRRLLNRRISEHGEPPQRYPISTLAS